MKTTKKILGILLACLMLVGMLSVGVCAAGTQDDPIDAKTKWMGFGVDTYLLNPTVAEGSDGMWYTLTAETAGVLFFEHSYKNVDYTITITLNGKSYVGGCIDGEPYNRPIVTGPVAIGDVITIQVVTKDAAAGTVYANMNVITGDADNAIKVKSNGLSVVVGAGKRLYFQDDSLNAIYATKGLLVAGDVSNTTFYTVTKNAENGTAAEKAFTDSDNDGVIETNLGGSLGSAGAPPVKPAWAIANNSAVDQTYTLTIVDTAHECVYDDAADMDCNSCGAIRNPACNHTYDNALDADCNQCSETREVPGVDFVGFSTSADVNGLAAKFTIDTVGMEMMDGTTTAVYDNATIAGYKLISMGAVVWNTDSDSECIENADGLNVLDIPAEYLYELTDGAATFAIRIVDIPAEYADATIYYRPYFIYEDESGQQVVYGDCVSGSYNAYL